MFTLSASRALFLTGLLVIELGFSAFYNSVSSNQHPVSEWLRKQRLENVEAVLKTQSEVVHPSYSQNCRSLKTIFGLACTLYSPPKVHDTERRVINLSHLPMELLQYIARLLPLGSATSFTLCSRSVLRIVGTRY